MDQLEQRELRRLERTLSKKGSNNTIQRNTPNTREDMTKKAAQKATAKPAAEPTKPAAKPAAEKEPAKSPAADQGSQNAPQNEEGRKKDAQQHVNQITILNNEQPATENSENSAAVEQVRQLHQQVQDEHQDAGPENQQTKHSEVHFVCPFEGNATFIAGTFNNWNFQPMSRGANNKYELALRLPAGTYFYKFVVDGDWKYDPDKPISSDAEGYENNVLVVP